MSDLKTEDLNILWKDRKRILLFGLPWTFTKYSFNEERFFMETGLFKTVENEVRLYRIMDLKLSRSFFQKLFDLGTITVASSDRSLHNFEIKNIKDSKNVKEKLSELVEAQRNAKRVMSREIMSDQDDDIEDMDGGF
ncbi:MAG: PH domain-containing protein [Lachnospiraceae bacterium]|nr:PH domain-containing protein [Lachnospiraceae bacterium]